VDLYRDYPRIEEELHAALRESLHPRGPDLLYDLVRDMELRPGSAAVDVGCGDLRHSLRLAELFELEVLGVDPVPQEVDSGSGVRFVVGTAEALPLDAESVELVWCRDVLVHVADLDRAYAEFHRVLRPGGRALVYQMFAGPRLEPREVAWLWQTIGVVPTSTDPECTESAIASAGLKVDQRIVLGSEWGEWAQEQSGKPGERLLHAARLLRDPDRYAARFGRAACEIALVDCLWHVYAMIGKLERRVYVLSK
jgi:SAM-dependent methyltransferase